MMPQRWADLWCHRGWCHNWIDISVPVLPTFIDNFHKFYCLLKRETGLTLAKRSAPPSLTLCPISPSPTEHKVSWLALKSDQLQRGVMSPKASFMSQGASNLLGLRVRVCCVFMSGLHASARKLQVLVCLHSGLSLQLEDFSLFLDPFSSGKLTLKAVSE